MIQDFVNRFMANEKVLRAKYSQAHPRDYAEIVKDVVSAIADGDGYGGPNPDAIHEINDGHYQGTLVYVIPEAAYQPHEYWYVRVWYGSCSACDTLDRIHGYTNEPPTAEQASEYWGLALNVVQGIRAMSGEA